MDTAQLGEMARAIFKKYLVVIVILLIGLIFLGYGLISAFGGQKTQSDITFDFPSQENTKATQSAMLVVDIEGAVEKPGVYEMPQNARVNDLLIISGGLLEEADKEWVEKHINLSAKLTDSFKLYIPKEGEVIISSLSNQEKAAIDINSASSSILDSLPGIGQVTAEKIIAERPYTTINELVEKKVITQKVFEKIKDRIGLQ